jgi:large subunit ribosomal protein L10
MRSKAAKAEWRDALVTRLDKAEALYFTNYSGMTVEELTNLRVELKKVQADFHVIKNTVARKAIEGRDEATVSGLLKGQIGVVFANGDVAAAAKTVVEVAKKNEKFQVLGGFFENKAVGHAAIQQIASLPPREVLIAKIIGSMVAPHRGLVGIINAVPSAMVRVLGAIKDAKSA